MYSFQPQSRRATLLSLIGGVATSVCVLGATVLLFGQAGRTPTFEPGSALALQAAQCPSLAQAGRHECLREIAAAAQRGDTVVVARVAVAASVR